MNAKRTKIFAFGFPLLFLCNITILSSDSQVKGMVRLTHGIASGDITDHSAVIWARASGQAKMHVEYGTSPSAFNRTMPEIIVNQSTQFVGHIKLNNLTADTLYFYRVWLSPINQSNTHNYEKIEYTTGQFRTAPAQTMERDTTFIVGGDLGGHELCRRPGIGYSIFQSMKMLFPDFFVFSGDQIYADLTCPEFANRANFTGWYNIPGNFPGVTNISAVNWNNLTQLNEVYLNHWLYNRADRHLQEFLGNTSLYSQADDHEVIDNYGGQWDYYPANKFKNIDGYPNLVKAGIDAFFNFSPIDRNKEDPNRIYRMFNWGKNLDLILLDAHTYRSRSDLPDTAENNKTLYGREQLRWLGQSLVNSKATWKVISNPVPITIPHCFAVKEGLGCDNWATNTTDKTIVNQTYTRERQEFLRFLDQRDVENVIFLATDVHFAANLRVEQDFDGDGDMLIYYEMVNGPLSAAIHDPYPIDPTINATYSYRETGMFNFGFVEINEKEDEKAHFLYKVVDDKNFVRPGSSLDLIPQ